MPYLRAILRRQGSWRSDLLWRIFGLCIFQFGILNVAFVKQWQPFLDYRLQWLFAAGILLMLGGGRILVLLTSWAFVVVHYLGRLSGSAEVQIGEEFGLFLSLPLLATVGYVVAARAAATSSAGAIAGLASGLGDTDRCADETQIALFRAAAISTLLWATLHKINTDFLDPAYSCGPLLAAELKGWWSIPLPDLVVRATPWRVIISEGLCPILLLVAPRAGLVWTTLVIGTIGHRGATAFAMLAVGLGLSVLDRDDGRRLSSAARRTWPVVVTATVCLVSVSAKTYIGSRPWYEYMLMQVFLLLVLYTGAYLTWHDLKELARSGHVVHTLARATSGRTLLRRLSPGPRGVHAFIACVWLVAMINGLSPYLGWKYRLSFAMLSNLRVDDARWNSRLIPRFLSMRQHDPFVHVLWIGADDHARQVLAMLYDRRKTQALQLGLLSPKSLEYRMRFVRYHGLAVDLELMYGGRRHQFDDVAHNAEFDAWLERLPKTLLIQDHLTGGGPQPCTH